MFESFLSPIILGYAERFFKNLPDMRKLSLWSGRIVLTDVELRSEAINPLLPLMSLIEGHVSEVVISVPWTALGSEPVRIELQNVNLEVDLCSARAHAKGTASGDAVAKVAKTDAPHGWTESLFLGIMNNVCIHAHNVTITYAAPTYRLCMFVGHLEVRGADHAWQEAFVSPGEHRYSRRLVEVHDFSLRLTDVANSDSASSTIISRMHIRIRMHGWSHVGPDLILPHQQQATSRIDVELPALDLMLDAGQFAALHDAAGRLFFGGGDRKDDGPSTADPSPTPELPQQSPRSVEDEGKADDDEGGLFSGLWTMFGSRGDEDGGAAAAELANRVPQRHVTVFLPALNLTLVGPLLPKHLERSPCHVHAGAWNIDLSVKSIAVEMIQQKGKPSTTLVGCGRLYLTATGGERDDDNDVTLMSLTSATDHESPAFVPMSLFDPLFGRYQTSTSTIPPTSTSDRHRSSTWDAFNAGQACLSSTCSGGQVLHSCVRLDADQVCTRWDMPWWTCLFHFCHLYHLFGSYDDGNSDTKPSAQPQEATGRDAAPSLLTLLAVWEKAPKEFRIHVNDLHSTTPLHLQTLDAPHVVELVYEAVDMSIGTNLDGDMYPSTDLVRDLVSLRTYCRSLPKSSSLSDSQCGWPATVTSLAERIRSSTSVAELLRYMTCVWKVRVLNGSRAVLHVRRSTEEGTHSLELPILSASSVLELSYGYSRSRHYLPFSAVSFNATGGLSIVVTEPRYRVLRHALGTLNPFSRSVATLRMDATSLWSPSQPTCTLESDVCFAHLDTYSKRLRLQGVTLTWNAGQACCSNVSTERSMASVLCEPLASVEQRAWITLNRRLPPLHALPGDVAPHWSHEQLPWAGIHVQVSGFHVFVDAAFVSWVSTLVRNPRAVDASASRSDSRGEAPAPRAPSHPEPLPQPARKAAALQLCAIRQLLDASLSIDVNQCSCVLLGPGHVHMDPAAMGDPRKAKRDGAGAWAVRCIAPTVACSQSLTEPGERRIDATVHNGSLALMHMHQPCDARQHVDPTRVSPSDAKEFSVLSTGTASVSCWLAQPVSKPSKLIEGQDSPSYQDSDHVMGDSATSVSRAQTALATTRASVHLHIALQDWLFRAAPSHDPLWSASVWLPRLRGFARMGPGSAPTAADPAPTLPITFSHVPGLTPRSRPAPVSAQATAAAVPEPRPMVSALRCCNGQVTSLSLKLGLTRCTASIVSRRGVVVTIATLPVVVTASHLCHVGYLLLLQGSRIRDTAIPMHATIRVEPARVTVTSGCGASGDHSMHLGWHAVSLQSSLECNEAEPAPLLRRMLTVSHVALCTRGSSGQEHTLFQGEDITATVLRDMLGRPVPRHSDALCVASCHGHVCPCCMAVVSGHWSEFSSLRPWSLPSKRPHSQASAVVPPPPSPGASPTRNPWRCTLAHARFEVCEDGDAGVSGFCANVMDVGADGSHAGWRVCVGNVSVVDHATAVPVLVMSPIEALSPPCVAAVECTQDAAGARSVVAQMGTVTLNVYANHIRCMFRVLAERRSPALRHSRRPTTTSVSSNRCPAWMQMQSVKVLAPTCRLCLCVGDVGEASAGAAAQLILEWSQAFAFWGRAQDAAASGAQARELQGREDAPVARPEDRFVTGNALITLAGCSINMRSPAADGMVYARVMEPTDLSFDASPTWMPSTHVMWRLRSHVALFHIRMSPSVVAAGANVVAAFSQAVRSKRAPAHEPTATTLCNHDPVATVTSDAPVSHHDVPPTLTHDGGSHEHRSHTTNDWRTMRWGPDPGNRPLAGQLTQGRLGKSRWLAWRYMTPRALTQVLLASPYPFPLAHQRDAQASDAVEMAVQCMVEYWDDTRQRYERVAAFVLRDTDVANASPVCTWTEANLVWAEEWRIAVQPLPTMSTVRIPLNQGLPPQPNASADAGPPLPPAAVLTTCLCVASCFDAAHVATLSLHASVGRLMVSLVHADVAREHDIVSVHVHDAIVSGSHRRAAPAAGGSWSGLARALVRCDFASGRDMSQRALVEPFTSQLSFGVSPLAGRTEAVLSTRVSKQVRVSATPIEVNVSHAALRCLHLYAEQVRLSLRQRDAARPPMENPFALMVVHNDMANAELAFVCGAAATATAVVVVGAAGSPVDASTLPWLGTGTSAPGFWLVGNTTLTAHPALQLWVRVPGQPVHHVRAPVPMLPEDQEARPTLRCVGSVWIRLTWRQQAAASMQLHVSVLGSVEVVNACDHEVRVSVCFSAARPDHGSDHGRHALGLQPGHSVGLACSPHGNEPLWCTHDPCCGHSAASWHSVRLGGAPSLLPRQECVRCGAVRRACWLRLTSPRCGPLCLRLNPVYRVTNDTGVPIAVVAVPRGTSLAAMDHHGLDALASASQIVPIDASRVVDAPPSPSDLVVALMEHCDAVVAPHVPLEHAKWSETGVSLPSAVAMQSSGDNEDDDVCVRQQRLLLSLHERQDFAVHAFTTLGRASQPTVEVRFCLPVVVHNHCQQALQLWRLLHSTSGWSDPKLDHQALDSSDDEACGSGDGSMFGESSLTAVAHGSKQHLCVPAGHCVPCDWLWSDAEADAQHGRVLRIGTAPVPSARSGPCHWSRPVSLDSSEPECVSIRVPGSSTLQLVIQVVVAKAPSRRVTVHVWPRFRFCNRVSEQASLELRVQGRRNPLASGRGHDPQRVPVNPWPRSGGEGLILCSSLHSSANEDDHAVGSIPGNQAEEEVAPSCSTAFNVPTAIWKGQSGVVEPPITVVVTRPELRRGKDGVVPMALDVAFVPSVHCTYAYDIVVTMAERPPIVLLNKSSRDVVVVADARRNEDEEGVAGGSWMVAAGAWASLGAVPVDTLSFSWDSRDTQLKHVEGSPRIDMRQRSMTTIVFIQEPESALETQPTSALPDAMSVQADSVSGGWEVSLSLKQLSVCLFVADTVVDGSDGVAVGTFVDPVAEALHLCMKGVFVSWASFPVDHEHAVFDAISTVRFVVDDVQLDNNVGWCEFPVILSRKAGAASRPMVSVNAQMGHGFGRHGSGFSSLRLASVLRAVTMAVAPLQVRLEDSFLAMLRHVSQWLQVSTWKPQAGAPPGRRRTPRVWLIDRLVVKPLRLWLTVHARVPYSPVYLGVDQTPIFVNGVELEHLCSALSPVVQHIMSAYIADSVLRTPALLGSLELLGNPTGFVSNVVDGVYDLLLMPAQGLRSGSASAVVLGLGKGTSSLLQHISSGTLSSITAFSTSMARNLDRLSLDTTFASKRLREQQRRHRHLLVAGFLSGLWGLGEGIVDGVVGVVSKPLAGARDHGVVGMVRGAGVGLMGALTKPLGGAMELVSRTSSGLLNVVRSPAKASRAPKRSPMARMGRSMVNESVVNDESGPMVHMFHVTVVSSRVRDEAKCEADTTLEGNGDEPDVVTTHIGDGTDVLVVCASAVLVMRNTESEECLRIKYAIDLHTWRMEVHQTHCMLRLEAGQPCTILHIRLTSQDGPLCAALLRRLH